MKSSVETLSATRTKITVEVPFDELKPEFDKAYAALAQQVSLPGFRKGKVPPKILETRLGRGAILQEVVNEMLPSRYGQALEENKISPLGQPEIDITELEDGDHVTFTAEVDVRPEITVPDFAEISVEVAPISVDESDVEQHLKDLLVRFASLKTVERAAEKGDFATINLSATIDGETVDEATTEGLSYEIGDDSLLEGLDAAVTGLSAGEEATFTTKLVAGEHAGEEAEVTVKVDVVKERELPELDDDFAQLASEFDTLEELKEDVRNGAQERAKATQAGEIRDQALAEVLKAVEIPLPEGVVNEQVQEQIAQITQQFGGDEKLFESLLAAQGVDRETFEKDTRTSTEDSIRTQFLLDAIAEEVQPEVSQDEFRDHVAFTAMQYGMEPTQLLMQLQQSGQIGSLYADVRRGKALAQKLTLVSVKDTEGNEIDPKQYFEDEAPEAAEAAEATEADNS